jgi:hypothetical protein
MTYGYVRHKEVETALDQGDYAGLADRAAILLAGAGGLLGLATIVLVVINTS